MKIKTSIFMTKNLEAFLVISALGTIAVTILLPALIVEMPRAGLGLVFAWLATTAWLVRFFAKSDSEKPSKHRDGYSYKSIRARYVLAWSVTAIPISLVLSQLNWDYFKSGSSYIVIAGLVAFIGNLAAVSRRRADKETPRDHDPESLFV